MTLLIMILLGASQMYAQDTSYFFLDCPADVTVALNDPADGLFVDIPLAIAYGVNEPFVIVNDYNDGGADASDVYLVGNTVVTFTAFDSDSGVVSCSTLITVLSGNDSTNVYGCTDPEALNYNPLATIDDGSCFYDTDSNLVPIITCPADIFIFQNDSFGNTMWVDVPEVVATSPSGIASITNSYNDGGANASDYYSVNETTSVIFTATDINGNSTSCFTLITISLGGDSSDVFGCMDPIALNYNPLATIDDGSCFYEDDSTMITLYCPSEVYAPVFDSIEELHFVNVPLAVATSPAGTVAISNDYNDGGADASGLYPFGITHVIYTATIGDNLATCITPIIVYFENDSTGGVYGCMDPEALNYNQQATIDDGSCIYDNDSNDVYGCMDPEALNYNPWANIDDGSCVYYNDSIPECTAIAAFQFTQIDPVNNIVEISNTSVWEGDATFFWEFGDGTTSTEPYPEHVYDEDGVYLVCLTINAQYGDVVCEDTYCDSIGLFGGDKAFDGGFTLNVVPSIMVGIAETSLFATELNLYPNPASSIMNIVYTLNSNADVNITIYDLSGRIVDFQFAFGSTGNNRERVDVTELQPGMYMLELSANKKDKVISRFIINR